MFNKYHFISDTKHIIKNEFDNIRDIDEFINEIIESEIIYYSDCFDIIKELHFTDFEDNIFGECNNVCQAAFCALYDLIYNESDILQYFDELTESITDEL